MNFKTTKKDYVIIGDRVVVGTPPKHIVRKRTMDKLTEKKYYQKHIVFMRFRRYFLYALKNKKSDFHLKKIVKIYFEKCVEETGCNFNCLRKFFVYLNNKNMLDLLPESATPYFIEWRQKENPVKFNNFEAEENSFQNIDLGGGRRRVLYFGESRLNNKNIPKLKDVEGSIDSVFWNLGRK